MTLEAKMKAPAMAKLATDELVTHELAPNELVMFGLATDKLVTEIQPELPTGSQNSCQWTIWTGRRQPSQ